MHIYRTVCVCVTFYTLKFHSSPIYLYKSISANGPISLSFYQIKQNIKKAQTNHFAANRYSGICAFFREFHTLRKI